MSFCHNLWTIVTAKKLTPHCKEISIVTERFSGCKLLPEFVILLEKGDKNAGKNTGNFEYKRDGTAPM